MNHHISTVVFPNSNYKLQYLHGMNPVMEAGTLKHISGSIYDFVDNLVGVGKLAPAALDYSMLIFRKGSVPVGSMIGRFLLRSTSRERPMKTCKRPP